MKCPACAYTDSKVIDSRPSKRTVPPYAAAENVRNAAEQRHNL